MSLPGASSGRSHVRGYSTYPVPKESHDQSPPDSRMGWDKGGDGRRGSFKHNADEMPPLTVRRAAEFAWAEKHLPDEHRGMVVSALIGLEVAGQSRSTGSVMARLESQGRSMAQMKAKGWT